MNEEWWMPLMQEFVDQNTDKVPFDSTIEGLDKTLREFAEMCFRDGLGLLIMLNNGFDCVTCVPPCGNSLLPNDVVMGLKDRLTTCQVAIVRVEQAQLVVDRQTKFFAHLDDWVKKCSIDSANYELRSVLKEVIQHV